MISVEDWAEIRRLYRAEGLPIRQIVRVMNVSRNTVRAAVRSDGPPRYERAAAGSVADGFEPRIRELLRVFPQMPSTVIAERIGWPYSVRTLSGKVAEWRPAYLPPDPASRTAYAAGDLAQDDFWFPEVEIPVGCGQVRSAKQLPVLTMVSGYSRWASAVLIPSRTAEDLFAGWWQLISQLGAVPRLLVWDGEGAIGRHPDKLTAECQAFRGTLAAKVYVCRPADPEAKGLVERFHDYLERSFLPGRSFASPADFNAQMTGWIATVNTRWRRHLQCSPASRIAADLAAMIALPPVPPVPPVTGWYRTARLPRDHYVRLDSNDYSVDPAVIGRRIEITADLARVRVTCDGRVAAEHERCWARHQTISDPVHLEAAKALRTARRLAVVAGPREAEVEQRDLSVYDRLSGGQGVA